MKAIIAGIPSIIKFKYADVPASTPIPGMSKTTAHATSRPKFLRRTTTAYIKNEQNEVLASVDALNSDKVPFTFAQGRKAAFAKLLKHMNIPRSERGVLWTEFLSQCPNTVKHISMRSEAIKKTSEA